MTEGSKGPRAGLPGTVLLLGATSFFTDAASEMIFTLLPGFLTGVLGAPAMYLGLVEGAADTVASLVKLGSGRLADRLGHKKALVLVGYGIAGAVRTMMALVVAPWQVLAIRVSDRIGKGIRAAPRDALIADAAGERAGRAFGFHRAMDHAGAVVGPLLALLFTSRALALELRTIFWLAAIPGAIAFALLLFVREKGRRAGRADGAAEEVATPAAAAPMPPKLKRYLVILFVFSLGNSSDAFLLQRANELGMSAPLVWTVLHVSKLASSYAFGDLSDRVSRTRLVLVGWAVYALTYAGFGFAAAGWQMWPLFAVYGLYYGLTEPAEKALVKDLAPPAGRGRAYGTYNFVVGVTSLPAGLLTGALWMIHPALALGVAAGFAAIAAALLAAWNRRWTPGAARL